MGQKANLLTLRLKKDINLTINNTKMYINMLNFLNTLNQLLSIKGIWVLKKTLTFSTNQCFIAFYVYYRSFKVAIFKKKKIILKSLKTVVFYKKLLFLFKKYSIKYKFNSLIFTIINSNKNFLLKSSKKVLLFLFKKTKKFILNVFSRRFTLYIDFLKLSVLLCKNKIGALEFIKLLMIIFKSLSKRMHTKFFLFLRLFFKSILYIPFIKKTEFSSVLGVKLVVHGKLQGKPRAKTSVLQLGCMPIQSFNKNISFAKAQAYNIYGAFGLRIWICTK